ncbi:MAG: YfcE family phosphodiesterase [Proteobacteria bacterium]|nr:YfcE family phosphodiesterase [Pseudomonadota bacterium]MBU1686749.1 YfcE family phosphodiesterase [Pseudomonadota bacterium]
MRIAIMSDSHDQIANLRAAVLVCKEFGVGMLIHCGDLISPFMLNELAGFGGPVHLVYGNNVGDQHLISQSCGIRYPTITHHGGLGAVEADGVRIAITHYPEMAKGIAAQRKFDVVCCGHNHRYQVEHHGETLLINPGELLGKDDQPGFCLFDTVSRGVERIEVGRRMEFADEI